MSGQPFQTARAARTLRSGMTNSYQARPGNPDQLGATFDGGGVNFALFSAHATTVELCLFNRAEALVEHTRIPLAERTSDVWHAYVPNLGPGQLYGYRDRDPGTRRGDTASIPPNSCWTLMRVSWGARSAGMRCF